MSNADHLRQANPWEPMTDALDTKHLGKLQEEAGELTSATARCQIQGIDEREPVTGKLNREWLEDEIADVRASSDLAIEHFGLDGQRIADRAEKKLAFLKSWHGVRVESPLVQLERLAGPIKIIGCPRFCDGGYRGCDACNTCGKTGTGFRLEGRFYPNTEHGFAEALAAFPSTRFDRCSDLPECETVVVPLTRVRGCWSDWLGWIIAIPVGTVFGLLLLAEINSWIEELVVHLSRH